MEAISSATTKKLCSYRYYKRDSRLSIFSQALRYISTIKILHFYAANWYYRKRRRRNYRLKICGEERALSMSWEALFRQKWTLPRIFKGLPVVVAPSLYTNSVA